MLLRITVQNYESNVAHRMANENGLSTKTCKLTLKDVQYFIHGIPFMKGI